jgi:hydrogen cyanide synthase HcnC
VTGYDIAVLGGGLVGSAIAWGLARGGARVAVLDEGDVAFRASRGNFGLVWVQSKGQGLAPYAAWTKRSSDSWGVMQALLESETGVNAGFARPGGFGLCLSEDELEARTAWMRRLHNQPGMVPYPYEVLDGAEIRRRLGEVGPEVAGGIYCPLDGHANPLRLLRGLHTGLQRRGASYLPEHPVERIQPNAKGFGIVTPRGTIAADRVVLTAGLGNARLAPMVGLAAPVRPQRGQILVTERVRPFLHHPVSTVRQTDEGSVMIGDSQEEAGFDLTVGTGVLGTMAERAIRKFPVLASLRVVRTWAALRVMTPDGFPIYQQSPAHPGAFLATCHSGVTLAAAHAMHLAPHILDGTLPDSFAPFHAQRFHVQPAA